MSTRRSWAIDAIYLSSIVQGSTETCRFCNKGFDAGESVLRRRWGEQGVSHLLCGYFVPTDPRLVPLEREAKEAVEKARRAQLEAAPPPAPKAPVTITETPKESNDNAAPEKSEAPATDHQDPPSPTPSNTLALVPPSALAVPAEPYGVASASRGALMRHCLAWTRFAIDEAAARSKAWMRWGLAIHDVFERHNAQRESLSLEQLADLYDLTPEQRLALPGAIDALRAYEPPALACAELAVAWNPETNEARELGRNIDRAYEEHGLDRSCEVPGTSDLVWMAEDGDTVVVLDLKSGFRGSVAYHEDQLYLLAVMLRRAWRTSGGARIGVLHLVDGEIKVTWRDVASYDLDVIEEEYRERFRVLRTTAELAPVPGKHCRERYCPALDACPKTTEAVEGLLPPSALVPRMRLVGPIASTEEAAYRASVLTLITTAADRLVDGLKEWVKDHGNLTLPNGDRWGFYEQRADDINATNAAVEALTKLLGEHVDLAVKTERTITKTGIKSAAKAAGKVQAETLRDALAALEAVGALDRGTRKKCGFYK